MLVFLPPYASSVKQRLLGSSKENNNTSLKSVAAGCRRLCVVWHNRQRQKRTPGLAGLGLSASPHHTASLLPDSERASQGGTSGWGPPKLHKHHMIFPHVYALKNLPLANKRAGESCWWEIIWAWWHMMCCINHKEEIHTSSISVTSCLTHWETDGSATPGQIATCNANWHSYMYITPNDEVVTVFSELWRLWWALRVSDLQVWTMIAREIVWMSSWAKCKMIF